MITSNLQTFFDSRSYWSTQNYIYTSNYYIGDKTTFDPSHSFLHLICLQNNPGS